jgi:galactoside O-acetyltransferase
MPYFARHELELMGFKAIGQNVLVSTKASIYNASAITIGDNSRIDDFCVVSGCVTIGRNVHITVFCNLAGGDLGITMEDFTTLAYGVHVFTQSDDYSGKTMTNSTVPEKYKCITKKPVIIRRYVIIGAGSMILPGVTVNEGCSVGAMSMITRDTEPWKIYVGIPARPIRDRSQALIELEQQYLCENGTIAAKV